MARDTEHDKPLTPAEQKKEKEEASAKGHDKPTTTDTREAIKSHEQLNERPKNTGNPNRTGNTDLKQEPLRGGPNSAESSP